MQSSWLEGCGYYLTKRWPECGDRFWKDLWNYNSDMYLKIFLLYTEARFKLEIFGTEVSRICSVKVSETFSLEVSETANTNLCN